MDRPIVLPHETTQKFVVPVEGVVSLPLVGGIVDRSTTFPHDFFHNLRSINLPPFVGMECRGMVPVQRSVKVLMI